MGIVSFSRVTEKEMETVLPSVRVQVELVKVRGMGVALALLGVRSVPLVEAPLQEQLGWEKDLEQTSKHIPWVQGKELGMVKQVPTFSSWEWVMLLVMLPSLPSRRKVVDCERVLPSRDEHLE